LRRITGIAAKTHSHTEAKAIRWLQGLCAAFHPVAGVDKKPVDLVVALPGK
jgi:hypothetical protein